MRYAGVKDPIDKFEMQPAHAYLDQFWLCVPRSFLAHADPPQCREPDFLPAPRPSSGGAGVIVLECQHRRLPHANQRGTICFDVPRI